MEFPVSFISAGEASSTLTEYVPAPYFRKGFTLGGKPQSGELLICGLGFYELFINGTKITKGALAPYISAPTDLVYYDKYDLMPYLQQGENVLGVLLGNGFQNNPGGYVWNFDKAVWRGSPRFALRLEAQAEQEKLELVSDQSFKTAPSPIYNDDYRNGEYYDARLELPGWNEVGFDDSGWKNAQRAQAPTGTPRICEAEPIVVAREISPVSVTMQEDGALYDFGVNTAGVCRLKIQGKAGQVLSLYHGEVLVDGRLNRRNISFSDNDYVQKDIYICKGNGEEIYVPTFTYHGFRYVFVKGMTAQQATSDALTYLEMYSDLKELGGFSCSDSIVNKLQEITRRSDLANFYYFPTDCPQREKNGWTADAALSAEHMLLNLSAEVSFREWMRNICKAQADNGALPGIIPTGGWGFGWGNGPAWDCVLVYLPYFTYLYRGDRKILEENAHAILRYLDYLTTQIRPDGLIAIGLGDWCPVGRSFDKYKAPLELTDTVVSMDICEKAAAIFDWLGRTEQKKFAQGIYARLRTAARERLIDFSTMTAHGNCQTSQVMAIFYNVFEPAEKQAAFARLLDLIYERDNRMDVGVLGGRVLFHVLSSFGFSDLAYEMITMPGYPSYANWIERGATSLWEDFQPEGGSIASLNHHFWGDISHWFIRWLGGIHYNTHLLGNEVDIAPAFVEKLNHAEAYYIAPEGRIEAKWKRQGDGVILSTVVPEGMNGYIRLPDGYEFEDGIKTIPVVSGEFNVKRTESVLA